MYEMDEVLQWVGEAGKERKDPWFPLQDPLVTQNRFQPDYRVNRQAVADGKTQFHTIQAAIQQALIDGRAMLAKGGAKQRLYIEVAPAEYRELLYVPATAVPITLYSTVSDASKTKIVANLHAALLGRVYSERFGAQFTGLDASIVEMYDSIKGRQVIGTNGSAVAWIRGAGFQIKNITLENAYNKEPNKEPNDQNAECPNSSCGATAGTAPVVVVHHQAVALMVEGADKVQFENIRLHGFQDTLYLRSSKLGQSVRSFFHQSYVEGNVDFIFGDTTAYFYRCEIKSLGDRSTSYVVAPNTNLRSAYGFVFNQCRFTNDGSSNALAGKFYLARQWFHTQKCTPYATISIPNNVPGYRCELGSTDAYQAPLGSITRPVLETVGKVVVMNSQIGPHIQKQHPWADWNRKGSLAYRPAQFAVSDFLDNLRQAGFDVERQFEYRLPLDITPNAAIFLAEFNNEQL
ncbi:pectinesterase family protein [Undibacterium cyanobacteriorum]